MAKKKEKGKKQKESASPADALRDAVERTFAGAASGTAGAQKKAQELFDEVTAAMAKVREAIKGEDADAMKSAIEQLEQASHAFSKTLYESAESAGAGAAGAGTAAGATDGKKPEEEAIDAEFEVKE